MVVQRDSPIRLRGWAPPGTPVSAKIVEQSDGSHADESGKWLIELEPLAAGGPHVLSVTIGGETQTFEDVMIGEVWLCSGQSNMQLPLNKAMDAEREIAAADDSLIRHIQIPAIPQAKPMDEACGTWAVCSPETAGSFTAVGYFFARVLRRKLGVPIGLIHASNGHTPCEAWTSRETLESDPRLKPIVNRWDTMLDSHPGAREDLTLYRHDWGTASKAADKLFDKWYETAWQLRKQGKPIGPMPELATGVCNPKNPTVLFNGTIAPLVGYPLRGVIWYQGETNAIFGSSYQYRTLFPAMIADWRKRWNIGDFPFLYVQIANHNDLQCEPADDLWAELRDSQRASLSTPNTAMVVTIDIGETHDIHPANKQDVGRRLALAALARAYGRDVVYSGPIYKSHAIDRDRIRVTFSHTNGGLVLKGQEGFIVAGKDMTWHPVRPTIDDKALILYSPQTPNPVAVRYAWAADPPATLFNGEGLPASPFRTDDWPGVTNDNR